MSLDTLCEIALALNCSTDELLGVGGMKRDAREGAKELLALAQELAEER